MQRIKKVVHAVEGAAASPELQDTYEPATQSNLSDAADGLTRHDRYP